MGAAGNKKPKKSKAGKRTPAYELDSESVVTVNKANKKAKK